MNAITGKKFAWIVILALAVIVIAPTIWAGAVRSGLPDGTDVAVLDRKVEGTLLTFSPTRDTFAVPGKILIQGHEGESGRLKLGVFQTTAYAGMTELGITLLQQISATQYGDCRAYLAVELTDEHGRKGILQYDLYSCKPMGSEAEYHNTTSVNIVEIPLEQAQNRAVDVIVSFDEDAKEYLSGYTALDSAYICFEKADSRVVVNADITIGAFVLY